MISAEEIFQSVDRTEAPRRINRDRLEAVIDAELKRSAARAIEKFDNEPHASLTVNINISLDNLQGIALSYDDILILKGKYLRAGWLCCDLVPSRDEPNVLVFSFVPGPA